MLILEEGKKQVEKTKKKLSHALKNRPYYSVFSVKIEKANKGK